MFFYSWTKLKRAAAAGDLFVCHIVREAQPLFDPEKKLETLRDLFRYRDSYAEDIAKSADLGWYLDRFGATLDPQVAARRMVWCVRTILIARSVEAGTPVFAPEALGAFAMTKAARELIHARHQRRPDALMRGLFRQFLRQETEENELRLHGSSEAFEAHFKATGNTVAQQTISKLDRGDTAQEIGNYK